MLRASVFLALALAAAFAQEEKSAALPAEGSIVLDRLVSFPEYGKTDVILLRNMGSEAVDLRGWWLTDSSKDKHNPERSYLFAAKEECAAFRGLPPAGVMELKPLTKSNPCGIPFGVSIRDEANLFNKEDHLVATASWDWSLQGLVMRRMPDGSYKRMQENKNLHNVLEDFPDLYLFREALQATGLFQKLSIGNGNSTDSNPNFPFESVNDALPYQLPESMQPSLDSSSWPVVYDAKHYDFVPDEGPFTVLAPSSSALKDFFATWGPAKGLDKEQIFALPKFREVMKSHIIPGAWMSGMMFDGTAMPSSSGVNIVASKEGGIFTLHTGCSDEAPPGEFTCEQQKNFGKCLEDYIVGSGHCIETCGLCDCHMGSCAEVVQPDIYAKNGFIHILDKVVDPSSKLDAPKINNQLLAADATYLRMAVDKVPAIEPDVEENIESIEFVLPDDLSLQPTESLATDVSEGSLLAAASTDEAVSPSGQSAVVWSAKEPVDSRAVGSGSSILISTG